MIIELIMTITLAQAKTKQPQCKSEPLGVNVTAVSVNGIPYVCRDGKYVPDEASMKASRDEHERRMELVWAARTRILTNEEMVTLKRLGTSVFDPAYGMWTVSGDNEKRLNDLLLQQFEMRLIAEKGCKAAKP